MWQHALVSASSSPGNYAPSSGKAPEARPLFRSQPIGHLLLLLRDSPAFHNRKDHRGPHREPVIFKRNSGSIGTGVFPYSPFTRATNWLDGLLYIGRPFS